MNYVGHLLLTLPHTELTIGNLIGDMIRAREAVGLPAGIRQGIRLHHQIDRYTDSHTSVRRIVSLLRERHGKYAPVVVDILFDRVLIRQWERHSTMDYEAFAAWVYAVVPDFLDVLPERIAGRLRSMVAYRWLDAYTSDDGLAAVLARMDQRARFTSHFADGLEDLGRYRAIFEDIFPGFYDDAKTHIIPMLRAEDVTLRNERIV